MSTSRRERAPVRRTRTRGSRTSANLSDIFSSEELLRDWIREGEMDTRDLTYLDKEIEKFLEITREDTEGEGNEHDYE